MKGKDCTFVFRGWKKERTGTLRFCYAILLPHATLEFTEKLILPNVSRAHQISPELEHRLFDQLLLVLGVSYWKLYCPGTIDTGSVTLTADQATFWNTLYTKGLGEFFYKNNIDFRGLVQFPYRSTPSPASLSCPTDNRSLVQLGGGKDSVVTAELLIRQKNPFVLACLDPKRVHVTIAGLIGKPLIGVRRIIDPQLQQLNRTAQVYNGHVPISAMYAFVDLVLAAMGGWRYIIASNEGSANYGNVGYLGVEINHQWSKSLEFEQLFSDYVRRFVTCDITYFSLLRPLTEINIARVFCGFPKYFGAFTSCNTNFRISDEPARRWCGTCPKCAFVFLLLAAYLPRPVVLKIFGKNLFADTSLLPMYKALLGLEAVKPFECVGTPEESRFALWMIMERGSYEKDAIIKTLRTLLPVHLQEKKTLQASLFALSKSHKIPKEFQAVLATI